MISGGLSQPTTLVFCLQAAVLPSVSRHEAESQSFYYSKIKKNFVQPCNEKKDSGVLPFLQKPVIMNSSL